MESEQELVRWQETIQYTGTREERDAAFAAFKNNKDGQHFVFGYSHSDEKGAPKTEKPVKLSDADLLKKVQGRYEGCEDALGIASGIPAEKVEQVSDLQRRMQESRERRGINGTSLTGGRPPIQSSNAAKRPNRPATPARPKTALEEAGAALDAFMGHNR